MAKAIASNGFGQQSIASRVVVHGFGETLPLDATFALFGQRYAPDARVLSNVVCDRVNREPKRYMPSPLDAAFGGLDDEQAVALLQPELEKYGYAPELHLAHQLVVGAAGPSASLYGDWIEALRALSPAHAAKQAGLPSPMRSEAWGRRLLETQRASWAELRHETLLYAKQSYPGGAACEFPDGCVDPYPEVFLRLAAFAERAKEVATNLGLPQGEAAHWTKVQQVLTTLAGIAEAERTGTPLSSEHLAFLNQTVVVQKGCDISDDKVKGWRSDLYLDEELALRAKPIIADVHTQPFEGDVEVGRVLHVGTGIPRAMVVGIEGCGGRRAYVGLASSYFEWITEGYERLDDMAWQSKVNPKHPEDPPFFKDFIVR